MGAESEIQNTVLAYLKYRRVFHWRQNSGAGIMKQGAGTRFIRFGVNGAPDIFAVKDGTIYGLEIKSKVGKQNDNQKEFQEGFEKAGGVYHIVRCLEDVQKIGL